LISQEGTTYQVDFYITFVKGHSCVETVEQKKSISERRIGINMSSRTNPVARPRRFVLSRIYFVLFKACEESTFIWATSIAAHSELEVGSDAMVGEKPGHIVPYSKVPNAGLKLFGCFSDRSFPERTKVSRGSIRWHPTSYVDVE
jgi:hypothetical protein